MKLDPEKLPLCNSKLGLELTTEGGTPDLLAMVFEGQTQLMERYHEIEARNGCVTVLPSEFGEIDDRDVQMRIKDLCSRSVEELYEAMNCLKNKPWKNTYTATDREHFYEELGDAFHFFVELCITAGMDADDLFSIYFRKHAVNQFRQESNY